MRMLGACVGQSRSLYNTLQAVGFCAVLYCNCNFKLFLFSAYFLPMIIEKLESKDCWERFLQYKRSGGHMTKKEDAALEEFIESEKYTAAVKRIADGGAFSLPQVALINKGFSNKKRIVFTFPEDENYVQKMISFLLLDYDYLFSENLYSFRKNMGVKKAVSRLKNSKGINEKYSFKIDVSDYFNSVNPQLLIPMIKKSLPNEERLVCCLEKTLLEPHAIKDGEKIEIRKGIMAGSPISAFLANLYLSELDKYFCKNNILYARYSDDIIVFADTEAELQEYRNKIVSALYELNLGINEEKVFYSAPHEEWTFLGFSFNDGVADVSEIAVKKIKAKMKRKANALIRWKNRKNAPAERAVRAFIKHFNKKFFDNNVNSETTWCRWFFPVIDTDRSLKIIDSYMQECIRYIATEKRSKRKYDFRYEDMKALGYKSLVNSFYKFKDDGIFPSSQ